MPSQRVASIARQVAAIVGIVIGLVPQVPLPGTWSRIVLVVLGGLLMIAEHYVSDPSTGTPASSSFPPTMPVGGSGALEVPAPAPAPSPVPVAAPPIVPPTPPPAPSPAPIPAAWGAMDSSPVPTQTGPNAAPPPPSAA